MRKAKSTKIPECSDWAKWFGAELARFNALSTQLKTYVRLVDDDDEDYGKFDEVTKRLDSLVRSLRRHWYSEELADIDYELMDPNDPVDLDSMPIVEQAEVIRKLKWAEGVRAKIAVLHNEACVVVMQVDRMTARYRLRGVTSVDHFRAENGPLLEELTELRKRQKEMHELQYPTDRSEDTRPVLEL